MYGSTKGGNRFTYKDEKTGKTFKMPIAGKTGTTQNFTDSWTACYSPYYTTVAWFGFDRRGQSLGPQSTGAGLASHAVANYMVEIHKGKANRDFARPETGLRRVKVCKVSGELPTAKCKDGTVDLWFLSGTEPKDKCAFHENSEHMEQLGIDRLKMVQNAFEPNIEDDDDGLHIDPDVFKEFEAEEIETPNVIEENLEGNGESNEYDSENETNENEKDENNEENEVNPWL